MLARRCDAGIVTWRGAASPAWWPACSCLLGLLTWQLPCAIADVAAATCIIGWRGCCHVFYGWDNVIGIAVLFRRHFRRRSGLWRVRGYVPGGLHVDIAPDADVELIRRATWHIEDTSDTRSDY
ncbi:hypothetical protein CBR_g49161 [Chara braunii]|uniref:Uncharacterized protein n=1 Tax=Chara braunii TaxID=69332 RepID=A0A388K4Z6_CHABU|nr:hypothetical protein CBR_g49161 [Chara braunii]|eukprot:GBG65086.1 hypothetical protein CBR_g49161 [Chara braunii]